MSTGKEDSMVASDDSNHQEVSGPGVDELIELGILTIDNTAPAT